MSNLLEILNTTLFIILGICGAMFTYRIVLMITALFPTKEMKKAKKKHTHAILIPARNESKVIADLLTSIKKQKYPTRLIDTYVIVSDPKDPTVEICKKFKRVECIVRANPPKKDCKGFVLNDSFKYIKDKYPDKKYEAFFIFDADNILSPTFIDKMNDVYDAGYDIALGYRNSKNWNSGWVADCSSLQFSMLNAAANKPKARLGGSITISGSGFYISSKIVEDLGGWPFHTLTEDYELSVHSLLKDYKTIYYEYADFYDEAPTKFKASWNQRMRWVKGFQQVQGKYKKELYKNAFTVKKNWFACMAEKFNILPIAIGIASVFLYIATTLVLGIIHSIWGDMVWRSMLACSLYATVGLYLFFMLYTIALLIIDRKKIKLKPLNRIVLVFMNPFFLATYIPLFIKGLFKKEVTWVRIDHSINVDVEKLLEQEKDRK